MDIGDDHREIREQQEVERLEMIVSAISSWLNTPLRPRNGIHEIMRMIVEVQNGTEQSRNRPIFESGAAHMEDQEIGDRETEDERDRPDDRREFQRAQIEPERQTGRGSRSR